MIKKIIDEAFTADERALDPYNGVFDVL